MVEWSRILELGDAVMFTRTQSALAGQMRRLEIIPNLVLAGTTQRVVTVGRP
jgi:hypothetical protein